MLVLIVANFRGKLIDIVYAKGMKRETPLYAKWNALSRVEVDKWGEAKAIVIDADASTYIMNSDPYHWDEAYRRNLMSAASSVANVLRPHGDFAIIGPGGGVDVLRAVANGSLNVTGIEINPIIATDIMRGVFADYAHHLYQIPEVHMHVSDGRSFVRNSRDRYDVVQMTLVDTWASTAAGAFALSENNLYTVEAFREYFEHLKPDGMVAITRWEFSQPREALRVVSQAMEALRQLGVPDSTQNFIVISDGALNVDGRPVLVLAKKSPFTLQEQQAVLNHIQGETPEDSNLNLHVLYLPATAATPGMAHPAFAELIRSQDARAFSEHYAFNVSPVTDNAPFFFFTLKPGQVLRGLDRGGIDWKVNLGIAILGLVLVISAAALLRGTVRAQPSPAVFHCHRLGVHPRRDRVHSALRIVFGESDLCPHRGGVPDAALQRIGKRALTPLVPRADSSRLGNGVHRGGPCDLRFCFAAPAGGSGGPSLRGEATAQCAAADSAGLRDGHAVSQRTARSVAPGFSPGECPGKTRRRGMGVGHERCVERAGLGVGDGDCHPVRIECNAGLRRRSVCTSHAVAAHVQEATGNE